jgi:hypothetical protein
MRLLLTALAISSVACSSKPQVSDEYGGGRFQERLGKQMKAMQSLDMESPFQKAFDSDSTVKTGSSSMQKKGFHSNDFTGFDRDFNGAHAARTKDFAGADKTSPTGNRTFNQGKENREGFHLFRSKSSRAEGQVARQGSQVASGMDRQFKTPEVRDAAKSQQKNIRPLIDDPTSATGSSRDYSEAGVRSLMSRD